MLDHSTLDVRTEMDKIWRLTDDVQDSAPSVQVLALLRLELNARKIEQAKTFSLL